MKLSHALAITLLLALAACRAVPSASQHFHSNVDTRSTTPITSFGALSALNHEPASGADSPPPAKRPKGPPSEPNPSSPATEWYYHICRGERLTQASKLDKEKAEAFVSPVDSHWEGSLQAERKLWGYTDAPFPDCDFDGQYYDITKAYEELNLLDGGNECFRTFHYDPEKVDKDGNDIELKDQRYVVNGQTYRATGAHGTFGVNVDEGVVWFIDRASAPQGSPAMGSREDLSWGFWYGAHGGSNLGHITKFIIPQVISETTLRLIDSALQTYVVPEHQERLKAVPQWPGITFEIETEQGMALLGSPNGIATAYFLLQHKQAIGANKYVHKVTVFRPDDEADSDEPTIIYYVKDAPTALPDEPKPENLGSSEELGRRDLAFTADVGSWHKCVCRGNKLTVACKNNKTKQAQFAVPIDSPCDGTMEAELKLWGYEEHPADSHCNFDDIKTALKALRIGRLSVNEGGPNQCYQVRHWYENAKDANGKRVKQQDQTYVVEDKKYRMTGAYSIIGANIRSGVIFFVDIRSAHHAAEELWMPEIPTLTTLPSLRSISDIAWAFWNRAHKRVPAKRRSPINYFVVHNIVNKETEQLIKRSLEVYAVPEGHNRVTELPKWPGLTFDVETAAGQAMLGSPNGIAAGYFLAQHKTQLGGHKYVYQIQIFASDWGGGPAMILHVKEAPTPFLDVIKRQENREQDNYLSTRDLDADVVTLAGEDDDAALWLKYVCRGEKLTQASIHNKDTATKFVQPIDSDWDGTLEAELKLWGYTDHDGKSIYCDLETIADSLSLIGINADFKARKGYGQNECFYVGHRQKDDSVPVKDQTYQVNGKTYRMTDAFSHMGVNARDGVVSFLNVRSAERGALVTWKAGQPQVAELPSLRRISDLAWGFWNRAHKNDGGLQNINKFLVHDVVNLDTLRLIELALRTYKVAEGQQRRKFTPKWPGLVFDIESDEGKAMLGSPNGVAAGYFLVQHKTQLGGNKYIYQVTVWKDQSGDEQMLFWVKDAPPPPAEEGELESPAMVPSDNTATHVKVSQVVERSIDGRKVIREHVVIAKL